MGFLDGIGQLLDPAGIFSSGNQQSDMNKIFDPLGLFPAIKGEAAKTQSNPEETVKTVKTLKGLFDANNVEAAGAQSGDVDASKASDPSEQAGTTEMPTLTDSTRNQDDGYALPNQDGSALGSDPQPVAMQSASTATQADASPQIQQSAATGVTDETAAEADALNTILAKFPYLDGGPIGDGRFDADSLRIVVSAAPGTYPQDLVEAARYLLDHPRFLNTLINFSALGNMCISGAGIAAYTAQMGKAEEKSPPPPPGNTPQPGNTPSGVDQYKGPSNPPQALGHPPASQPPPSGFDPSTDFSSVDRPGVLKPATDFETALGNMDDRLHSMENTMASLTDDMLKGMDPNASPAVKAQGQAAEKLLSNLQLRYQALMSVRKEMYELLSNIHKTYDDMSMHAINNIR